MDIPDVYGEIADAYFDRSLWAEALEVYKEMSENDEVRRGESDVIEVQRAHLEIFSDKCRCRLDQDCAVPKPFGRAAGCC